MSQPAANPLHSNSYPVTYPGLSMSSLPTTSAPFTSYSDGVNGGASQPPIPAHTALHAVSSAPVQFYAPYAVPPTGDPNAAARYPIPPNTDPRNISNLSAARQKKEIKRRTKTGCLTCRKRRIKCDEGHPSCRNCLKSKRECLGYDPTFKPQSDLSGISSSQPYSSATPSSSQNYIARPPRTLAPSAYGYPSLHSRQEEDQPQSPAESLEEQELDQDIPESGEESDSPPRDMGDDVDRQKSPLRIEELLCLNGITPPAPASVSEMSESTIEEMKQIYSAAYAPGMDKFLETRWFSERGIHSLLENKVLCSQFAMLIRRYGTSPQDPSYYTHLAGTQSLEAMIVWSMIAMCKKVAASKNSDTGSIDDADAKEGVEEAAQRLGAFEALVTGESLPKDTIPPELDASKLNGSALQSQLKTREYEFWRSVHAFLALHNDSPQMGRTIEEVLAACRALLESRENRDVIYSMMVVRHFAPYLPGFPDNLKAPDNNDERDFNAKLAVAKKLLEDEAGGRGTNQVVQRMCGIAVRSWALRR